MKNTGQERVEQPRLGFVSVMILIYVLHTFKDFAFCTESCKFTNYQMHTNRASA